MHLFQPGTKDSQRTAFQGTDNGEEFFTEQHACATKSGLLADFDQFRYAAYVIVVPVGRYDQIDGLSRIDADALQVPQGSRHPVRIDAGVNEDPDSSAGMNNNALAVTGTKKCKLELAFPRGLPRLRHSLSDRIVSLAHTSPSRKSFLVISGRSRNTI